MTKIGFASIYAMATAAMMLFIVYIGRKTDAKGIHVRRQLHVVLMMDMIYFASFFTNDSRILGTLHCIIVSLECWILYLFLQFGCRFTKLDTKWKGTTERIILIWCMMDSLLGVFNAITFKLYDFTTFKYANIEVFVRPNVNGWYMCHIILCILLEVIFVGVLFHKALVVSYYYRMRFLALGVMFTLGLTICMIMRVCSKMVQFPVVFIITLGEVVIFYVYYHLPKLRTQKMKKFVIKNIVMPIVMFDCDDELQIVNEPAKEFLNVEVGLQMKDFINRNNLKYILTEERRVAGKTKEFTLTEKIGDKVYLIYGQELWDNDKYFVGTLLIYNDITKQEKLKDEATYHATRDMLTGLWNREYFLEMGAKVLKENPNIDFVMVVSDIYQFKMFNDILGKKTGDDLLLSIARGFQEYKMPLWTFSRMAGDRFAMLMPKDDFEPDRFNKVCKAIIEKRDYALTVHFYLGVYYIVDRSLSVAEMCDRAYMALESIKGNLNTNVAYYQEEIRKKRLFEALNVDELQKALRERQFKIYLQPQIDSSTNHLVGVEALVRWFNPKRGMIPPNEFISAFEEKGMIAQLDYYVWEEACMQLQRWKEMGRENWSISVNISAKDFYLSDIYESITGLVEKYDIEAKNLKLEITETAFVLNVEEQMVLVKRLQNRGFIVEMDDFGSGYSSLNSLKDISVDVLKMDMKFFQKTNEQKRADKIVESIVNLAYNLEMAVIAEGVENAEQVEMLRSIGCKIIQGFYYSKPLPVEEFEEFAKNYEFEDIHEILMELKDKSRV